MATTNKTGSIKRKRKKKKDASSVLNLSSFKLKEASAYAANWINADHGVSG